VGMGQVGIVVAISCLEQDEHPDLTKTASDLRDIASRLRSSGK
jgi:hypothetical protein